MPHDAPILGITRKAFKKAHVLSNSSQMTIFLWGLQGKNLWYRVRAKALFRQGDLAKFCF
jgi:hypothetical protein